MNNKTIRVLLIDHNELFRTGVTTALQPYQDIHLAGTVSDMNAATDVCYQYAIDVVLLDILPDCCNGAEIIQQVRQHAPQANFIVLTHHRTVELVHDVFSAGAVSYLMKNISIDELVNAIREASRGNTIIAYEVAQALIKQPKTSSHIEDALTAREKEVMQLLMKGYKNSDIAEELVITLATVKKHVRKILTKLDVESRTKAVAVAYEHKFAPA